MNVKSILIKHNLITVKRVSWSKQLLFYFLQFDISSTIAEVESINDSVKLMSNIQFILQFTLRHGDQKHDNERNYRYCKYAVYIDLQQCIQANFSDVTQLRGNGMTSS